MVVGWAVILSALVYLCLLFAVAHWGDLSGRAIMQGRGRATVYALAIAVYCTSWTFFGSVGLASRTGLDFLTIYIGPVLVIGLGHRLVARVVRIAKAQNITSIADFVAARYGKSERVAALVCAVALVGTLPYIALQLKATSASLTAFLHAAGGVGVGIGEVTPIFGDLALLVAVVLAAFAVAFGTRHADATEHQNGLTLAIAVESVVKLVAFLAVGAFVTMAVFGDSTSIMGAIAEEAAKRHFFDQTSPAATFGVMILLSACVSLLLPRQFHMVVVENRSIDDVRRAAWLFPLYLVLINLFVVPLALAGLGAFAPGEIDRDMTVLALPLRDGAGWIALTAFLGGLSAGTAMVIVETVALAIMISNHLVMPLVLRRRGFSAATPGIERSDLGGFILAVRRLVILAVMLLGYAYHRLAGDAALASIGLLSFAAIAQIAPAFFGGLFWSRGTALGASMGLVLGFAAWAYTLLLPTLADGLTWSGLIQDGPFGIAGLRPVALLGLDLPQLAHGVTWSLALNVAAYVGFSLLRAASPLERLQATAFVGPGGTLPAPGFRLFRASVTVDELRATVGRYLGGERTARSFEAFAASRGAAIDGKAEVDIHLITFAEHLLSSAIGAASSRFALSLLLRKRNVSTRAALQLLDDASAAILHNRDLLQHALDHARQGITVIDRDLRLLCWNQAFIDLYDFPPDLIRVGVGLEAIVRLNAERGSYGPGPVDSLIASRLHSMMHDTEPVRVKLYPSGRVIEIRSNQLPSGGIVTTYTDVTPVVAEEQARRRANETLELRVRERTEELTRLNEALTLAKRGADEANASKTRFLAAASHDILQPLNAARLYAASLVERPRDPAASGIAENIDASLDAVEEILTALLDISRLDTGAMKPRYTVFRVEDLFRQLAREFEPIARAQGLRLTFVPVNLSVRSDRGLLRRLLRNLVSNAIKYTPSGRVLVGARRRGATLRLEVWDTGIGIPESKHKTVFREFQRLDQGAKAARGLGLGLSIVEGIAKVLDLPLDLRSAPGRGSVFRVEVPVAAGNAAETPARLERAAPAPLASLSVLAIDNEASILAGLKLLLENWGCRVTTALSLEAALAALAEEDCPPEVILADYHLDEGNGLQAIEAIRSRWDADLPAMLVTADRSPGLVEEAAAARVYVLNKPVRPAALRALLAQLRISRAAAE